MAYRPPPVIASAAADTMLVTLRSDPVFASTIPGKIQPYLACGRPILAMLDGEGARIVEDSGAGFSCPAGYSESLAEIVLRMYTKTREEREAMGQKGRSYYEKNFNRNMLFSRLESWMMDLVSAPSYQTGSSHPNRTNRTLPR